MKKLFVLVSCFAVTLVLSKVNFAQTHEVPAHLQTEISSPAELSVDDIVGEARSVAVPQMLPFGVPPYPAVGGYPAYGVPYSYKRAMRPRRLAGRFAPPPHVPYPLPAPGAVPGAMPPPAALPPIMGPVPPCQEMLATVPPFPPAPEGPPAVFYRPTPVKNFMTLISAPRPYIGYDPYVGYPPFPGYIPPQ